MKVVRSHEKPGHRYPAAPQGRRGTAAVQFALVAPWFFLFVLGLIEFGRGFMVTNELNSAARNGCRLGVLSGKTYSDITTSVDNDMSAAGITGYSTTIKVNDTVVTSTTFSPSTNDQVQVSILVPVGNVSWLPWPQWLAGSLYGQFNLLHE
jgi:Flp pilus assembly protein TadG